MFYLIYYSCFQAFLLFPPLPRSLLYKTDRVELPKLKRRSALHLTHSSSFHFLLQPQGHLSRTPNVLYSSNQKSDCKSETSQHRVLDTNPIFSLLQSYHGSQTFYNHKHLRFKKMEELHILGSIFTCSTCYLSIFHILLFIIFISHIIPINVARLEIRV